MKLPRLPVLVLAVVLLLGGWLRGQIGYAMASYHGVTHATHQAQFTSLSGQGYRLISLAVSGGLANARYSAVWQQVGGPSWVGSHGMSYSQYQSQATTWTGLGYRAKLVAASGVGSDVVFAAMWVADGVVVVHDQDTPVSGFDNEVGYFRSNGRRLVSCAQYTHSGVEKYAAVWEPDSSGVAWGAQMDDTAAEFDYAFDEFALAHGRPTLLTNSDSNDYAHVWRDDRVGNWLVVVDRTSAQFDADKITYDNQGLILTCITARGFGANARFGGLFQERLSPHARNFTRTGTAVAAMSGFDDYIENTLMTSRMVRNASIAVTKNGRLIYARGYTWAEPGSPLTYPTTPFRIGSISKPLCSTVVHDLISRGQGGISLSTNVASYLGISTSQPGGATTNLRRLLRHTSGLFKNPDPFDALAWANPPLVVMPVDERHIVGYAFQQAFTTVDQWDYSNAGLTAAGQVVEQATGQGYQTALRDRLFAPVGTTLLYQQMARPANFAPGEANYHPAALWLQPSTVHYDQRLLAGQYARDYWDSAGGAVTSAVTLARVVSGAFCIGDDSPSLLPAARTTALTRLTLPKLAGGTFTITEGSWDWDSLGGNRYSYHHDGGAEGFSARCVFTSDGVCIVVLTNADDAAASPSTLVAEADAVAQWPDHDLFPNYGLAAFPRRPLLTGATVASVPNVSDTALVYTGEFLDQVTAVEFDGTLITSQSQNTWHDGWFVRVSPTVLHVHPPQGLAPGFRIVRAHSPMGASGQQIAHLSLATQLAVKAPDTVSNWFPFAAIVSRGPYPASAYAVLSLSTDLLPTVLPGYVTLGIGDQFQSLLISDLRQFSSTTGTARWDFPTISGLPQIHFQAGVVDASAPSIWPLPVTNVETVVRVP